MKTPSDEPTKTVRRKATKKVAQKRAVRKAAATTRPRKKSAKVLVDKAIQNIGSKLDTDEVKGTVGDLIRLIEVKKKLESERPRDIEVKWVEESESND
jgi:hypothetical protein